MPDARIGEPLNLGALTLVSLLSLAPVALAHPHNYTNGTGDQIIFCNVDDDNITITPEQGINEGGVCIPAGHIPTFGFGSEATLEIFDFLTESTSAFYCQDLDGDGTCDGVVDTPFCDRLMLRDGFNWDSNAPVLVFLDGPLFGNFALTACPELYAGGTLGQVGHTP
jgi:hypothetical protein